jgi:transcriptional regulator with XRE-family HTH domain
MTGKTDCPIGSNAPMHATPESPGRTGTGLRGRYSWTSGAAAGDVTAAGRAGSIAPPDQWPCLRFIRRVPQRVDKRTATAGEGISSTLPWRVLGLTQAQLAARLGVTGNTVARWERRVSAVANEALVQIALERIEANWRAGRLTTGVAGGRGGLASRRPKRRVTGNSVRSGRTAQRHNLPAERSSLVGLTGRTLGVIGMGNIGREIVYLSRPFGLRYLAFDPFLPSAQAAAHGVELVDLDMLLRTADFVTVNWPLNAETYHLLDARRLGFMRSSSYLN